MSDPVPDPATGTGGTTWLDPPRSAWAVWHLDELAPSATVRRGDGPSRPLPAGEAPVPLHDVPLTRYNGAASTVRDVLATTETDAFLVVRDGRLVHEEYVHEGAGEGRHAVLSVTKSVVGCVVAVLADRGVLDLSAPVSHYVPDLAGSGYADATLRNLLDMRSGVRFVEGYSDPDSDINRMDRWLVDAGMHAYLRTLRQERPHGEAFRYRSSETDVLGWASENAAGSTMSELVSQIVWAPIGAEADAYISCDATGSPVHDGGLAARARDLARFGMMLLDGGTVPAPGVDGEPAGVRTVVPARWLRDSWGVDSDIRTAFLTSPSELTYRGGWYRNQLWFRPGDYGDVLMCLGIHGQLVHVCRRTRTVCVKLSHWPHPVDIDRSQDTLRMCDTVGGVLAAGGRTPSQGPGRGLRGITAGVRHGSPSRLHPDATLT